MATITGLSGQSSIYELVSQMSQLYRFPITRMESAKSDLSMLDTIYTDLKSKLKTLNDTAEDLADTINPPLEVRQAVSSDATILTATATSSAAVAAHSIFVEQLAKNHTMASDRFTSASTSIATAEGAGAKTFSITVDGTTKNIDVTIAADDTNEEVLDAVAYAINQAWADEDEPVTANAFKDTSTTSKMTIQSGDTGVANKMTLTDVTGTLLASLELDNDALAATDTSGGYVYSDAELISKLTLNGVNIEQDTNILDNLITGVTITLLDEHQVGDPNVSLSVSADFDAIETTIQDFIDDYNDVVEYLNAKTYVDPNTGVRGPLAGKSVYRQLLNDLRTTVTNVVSTSGSATVKMLVDLGITSNPDGTLTIEDATEFEDAVAANQLAVSRLFNSSGGFGGSLDALLTPFTKADGYIDTDKDHLSRRIKRIDDSIESLESRAAAKEKRLIDQYSRLMALQAQMSGFRDYLGSFLGA